MKKLKCFFGYVLHNCIAHPLLLFLPEKLGNRFHDWTAKFWDNYFFDAN